MKCGLSLLRHVFVSSKLFIAPFEMRRHLNIYIYQMYVLSNVSLCVATCLYMLNIHICSYMYIHVGTCNCISTCTISYLQPWSQTLGASKTWPVTRVTMGITNQAAGQAIPPGGPPHRRAEFQAARGKFPRTRVTGGFDCLMLLG